MLVHATSADGWAPLHLAAAFGGSQATALLLAHGAHVHRFSHNPLRNQPLHACIALSRDPETARILIAQGADVNMAQVGGYTPLHQAAAAGLVEVARILLEAGAKPDLRCDQGKTRLTMLGSAVMMGFCWCFRGGESGAGELQIPSSPQGLDRGVLSRCARQLRACKPLIKEQALEWGTNVREPRRNISRQSGTPALYS